MIGQPASSEQKEITYKHHLLEYIATLFTWFLKSKCTKAFFHEHLICEKILNSCYTQRVLMPVVKIHPKNQNLYAVGRIVVRPFGNNVSAKTNGVHSYFPYSEKVVLMTYFDRGSQYCTISL